MRGTNLFLTGLTAFPGVAAQGVNIAYYIICYTSISSTLLASLTPSTSLEHISVLKSSYELSFTLKELHLIVVSCSSIILAARIFDYSVVVPYGAPRDADAAA